MTVILLTSIYGCNAVRQQLTAHFGDTVHLSCTTSPGVYVDWMYNQDVLYVNGQIDASVRSKYSIDSSVAGQYILVIKNITSAEAGEYVCIDNAGHGLQLVIFNLTVTGNNKQSWCYILQQVFPGAETGLETYVQQLHFSCGVIILPFISDGYCKVKARKIKK